jgi:excisionase family DNA binding protein
MRLLTAEDIASELQVPKSWVYRAARDGRLPSVPCGRYVRFHPDDLAAWIDGQRATLPHNNPSGPRDVGASGGPVHGGATP